jgi:small subunit ribosomal protein S1
MTEPDSKTSETLTEEVAPAESPQGSGPKAADEATPSQTQLASESAPAPEPEPASEPAPASEPESAPASAEASAPEPAPASASESAEASAAESTTESGQESGQESAPEPASKSQTASGDAPATGKKKRRRRRKKKGATQTGSTEAVTDAKTAQHHAPFLHLFSSSSRKHAFSVGEVIAGRVERVEHGTIVVDLFGKATAFADADEPRDVPIVIHEPPHAHHAHVEVPTAGVDVEPKVPNVSLSDAAGWEFSPTEVTGVPDEDFVEADTVVGAPAYDPTVPPEPASETVLESATAPESATVPESESASAADTSSGAQAPASESDTHHGHEHDPEHEEEHEHEAAGEDLADADLSLLDPLPELEAPQPGAIFRGRIGAVAESGHIAIVNRLVDKAAVRKALRAAREGHQRVQGVVYGYNRGGFDVLVGGVRAFCPASAMSLTTIEDPKAFLGQRCEFSLPRDKGGKKSIIVSRRNILEKEARKRARERMEELEVGAKLGGKVLDVRDYGVLVDLGGGLDGLVHMSELSWTRGVRPRDVVKVGDEVEVQVLKIQPATRKDRYGRVSLSMRACLPDPWDAAQELIRPGMPIKGKVVRTTDFGAFVELRENVEGLLHISELGGNRGLSHAKQAVSEGDEIDVVVERVDREQRRISLSKLSEADARAIEAGEIEVGKGPRSLKPGSHISVVVKRVEHGGAQVQVDGVLGKRGRGFIPNRELQDMRGEKRKGLSQGDLVDVKVIGTERDGTLRCSVRARLLDEERKAVREYRKESAKQGLGTFGDLLKAKLGEPSD